MEEELKRLRRENRELKRANGILKTASAFFAAELDHPHDQMISFIDAYKDQFGLEAICRVLRQVDRGFIASRGYRKASQRIPSARALSDSLLIPEIRRVHAENFSVYGIRKMWYAMYREGFHISRDKTARLMKLAGVSGRKRGRDPVTTLSPKHLIVARTWCSKTFVSTHRAGFGLPILPKFALRRDSPIPHL